MLDLALQEVHLGRFEDALATVSSFLGGNGMQACRWAVHMCVCVHWLDGGLDQVCLQHQTYTAVCRYYVQISKHYEGLT